MRRRRREKRMMLLRRDTKMESEWIFVGKLLTLFHTLECFYSIV